MMPPPWVKSAGNQESTRIVVSNNVPSNFPPKQPSQNLMGSQKSATGTGAPKSLGALLQQAPLRALIPAVETQGDGGNIGITNSPNPTPLKTIKTPEPAGPLAGAKFVLPPIPPRVPLKAVSGKTKTQLAKIAALRHSVRPRPEDIGDLLREIEAGMKFNHVACDDRSKPLVGRVQTFYPEF